MWKFGIIWLVNHVRALDFEELKHEIKFSLAQQKSDASAEIFENGGARPAVTDNSDESETDQNEPWQMNPSFRLSSQSFSRFPASQSGPQQNARRFSAYF